MQVFVLQIEKIHALERVKQSIAEMEEVVRKAPSGSPTVYLAVGILNGLRRTQARLEGGIEHHQRMPRRG